MNRLNKKYKASKVVMALALEGSDELVGALVKFKAPKDKAEAKRMGTMACTHIYRIGGRQRCYGYDKNGNYGLVEGYRVFAVFDENGKPCTDDFGRAATKENLIVLSNNN